MTREWLVWQLVDSGFPAGGFAHSSGLEAAWQHGWVKNGEAVADFVRTGIRQCQSGVLGFVLAAWENCDRFFDADRDCDLFLNNHVANRASRAQGRAFLSTIVRIFPNESLVNWRALGQARASIHLAPVFGTVCASLQLSDVQTVETFLFIYARGCLSSAIRLGIIGPLEAQQIQYRLAMEENCSAAWDREKAVQTAPVLDLLQATQDRLYSKLFQS